METFDVSSSALGTGAPVSVAAGAGTVYSTGSSLYLASGGAFSGQLTPNRVEPTRARTQIYARRRG